MTHLRILPFLGLSLAACLDQPPADDESEAEQAVTSLTITAPQFYEGKIPPANYSFVSCQSDSWTSTGYDLGFLSEGGPFHAIPAGTWAKNLPLATSFAQQMMGISQTKSPFLPNNAFTMFQCWTASQTTGAILYDEWVFVCPGTMTQAECQSYHVFYGY